jgi:hypothetical protein
MYLLPKTTLEHITILHSVSTPACEVCGRSLADSGTGKCPRCGEEKYRQIVPTAMMKARRMIDQLYNRHSAGCCLHIVTDDGNIADNHVRFCVEYAVKEGHPSCEELAKLFLSMTIRQRAETMDMSWCPKCEDYSPYKICGMYNCGTKCLSLDEMDAA